MLVNNAGGAFGSGPVAEAVSDEWRAMYEVNVIGLVQVTRALLPALVASGAGVILNVGSTAGRIAYEGGGGYTAAKHGTQVVTETLRLELFDQPVRVCEIAPGMVRTDEFALVRFDGDQEKADAVYAGVAEPLTADDVAEAITWMVTRPPHVNIDELVIRPRAQAAQHKVHRVDDAEPSAHGAFLETDNSRGVRVTQQSVGTCPSPALLHDRPVRPGDHLVAHPGVVEVVGDLRRPVVLEEGALQREPGRRSPASTDAARSSTQKPRWWKVIGPVARR